MNREKLEAEVRDAIRSPQSEDECVRDILAAADSYAASEAELIARPPMRLRRREWHERERTS